MNMMAGPPLFKRAIVQTGEARAMLHPALSQDLEEAIDKRCNQLLLSFGCLTLDFGSTYVCMNRMWHSLALTMLQAQLQVQLLPLQILIICHGQCTELCGAVAQ